MLSSRVTKRLVAFFFFSLLLFPFGFTWLEFCDKSYDGYIIFRVCFGFGNWQRALYTAILAHPIFDYKPPCHHAAYFKQASRCNYKI